MPWLFRRRAPKLKEGPPATVADQPCPPAAGLAHAPTQRSARRRRGTSSSTASLGTERYDPPRGPNLHGIAINNVAGPPDTPMHAHASRPRSARTRARLQRPQSLRRDPPPDAALARRLSSRRRKDHDHVREDQIRAMSLLMPQKCPAAHSAAMQRRDSKRPKASSPTHLLCSSPNAAPALDAWAHASMSGLSEIRAFRVSALDMLSPRPTVRCSVESDPRRERRPLSSRADRQSRRSSRIDDLADTLDAGALREILERDSRHRDKKAKADTDRLRRRLERRAAKQDAAATVGTPATPPKQTAVVVGLGLDTHTSLTPSHHVRPSTPPHPQPATPQDSPAEEPVVADARPVRSSRGSVSAREHTRGPSNVSHVPELISDRFFHEDPFASAEQIHDPTPGVSLHPVDTADTHRISQGGSSRRRRSSDAKRTGIFASLFRRGKWSSQDRGRLTPSEVSYSNTSRESMSRQPLPAHLFDTALATPPSMIRRPSSVPRRTMSKFREDLPESGVAAGFPLSPPDSRVQSPDIFSASSLSTHRTHQIPSDLRVQSVSSQSALRSDSPVSPVVPVGNVMSQSLASVDSEGSWLSGRPLKRASNKSQVQSTVHPAGLQRSNEFHGSYEELGMSDDEYFKKLNPAEEHSVYAQSSNPLGRKASSTLMAPDAATESGEEAEPAMAPTTLSGAPGLVKSIVGRQPTIVHRKARVNSTEGLLSMFPDDPTASYASFADAADTGSERPESPASDGEAMMVQRATSLDIPKRSSTSSQK